MKKNTTIRLSESESATLEALAGMYTVEYGMTVTKSDVLRFALAALAQTIERDRAKRSEAA